MLLTPSFAILCAVILTLVPATATPINDEGPDRRVIYGFRQVKPDQAKRYNDAKTLTDEPNVGGSQIGTGVYMSPVRNGYEGGDIYKDSWHCVIYGSEQALKRVSKAWIPRQYGIVMLWFHMDYKIDEFIKDLNPGWDPAKTIRLSFISGMQDRLQMAIPHSLLNSRGGAMDISTECKEKWEDLPDVVVNYDDWKENIGGSRWDMSKIATDIELGISGVV